MTDFRRCLIYSEDRGKAENVISGHRKNVYGSHAVFKRPHGDLNSAPVFPETEETSAPVIERYLPSRDYEKRNRELKRARKFLKQRSQKTWFEIRLSAVIDPFLEEARQLCEEWKEIELAASDSGEEVPLCFCHGDYQYHNILRQDRGFFLVNFEKCQADGR